MLYKNTEVLNLDLIKYPRTAHLAGSRLQKGDEGHGHTPYSALAGRHIVVEEKLDGGNSGLSFSAGGELLLQSRGHYLTGGRRERQFNLFKRWATAHEDRLLGVLEDRYLLFGEWLHKKHALFYDALPHYFAEFDVWDRIQQCFLSTPSRHHLLRQLPVLSVPVLFEGTAPKRFDDLRSLLAPSLARSPRWRQAFEEEVAREGLDLACAWQQSDRSELAEGLYIKVEEDGQTVARYKWVRHDFVQAILDSGQHHAEQPYIANRLREGVDIFSPRLMHDWVAKPTGRSS